MILHILTFLAILFCVGGVNLLLSDHSGPQIRREALSFLGVVVGGIAAFTAAIVVISAYFQ